MAEVREMIDVFTLFIRRMFCKHDFRLKENLRIGFGSDNRLLFGDKEIEEYQKKGMLESTVEAEIYICKHCGKTT